MKIKDLTGMRFGNLLVLERADNIGSRVAWKCRCDCGKTIVTAARNLTSGRRTSCGCMNRKNGIERLHYIDGTCIEMISSRKVRRDSHSGVTGVYFDAAKRNWRAEIMFRGKRHYLGRFSREEDAVLARRKAEQDYFIPFLKEYQDREKPVKLYQNIQEGNR